jgi:hypothetical protein
MLCFDTAEWTQEGFTKAADAFNDSVGKVDPTQELIVDFTKDALSEQTAANASGYDAVCLFVNDDASIKCLQVYMYLCIYVSMYLCIYVYRCIYASIFMLK